MNEKHANLQSPAVTAEAAAAANEAAPIVAKLRTKALARLRHHLLHRVHALKKPQTNIQIKQNILLRNAPLYGFLQSLDQASVGSGTSGADVAAEVRTSYVNTMSQIYVQKFKGFVQHPPPTTHTRSKMLQPLLRYGPDALITLHPHILSCIH